MLLVSNLNKDKNTLGHSTRSLLHMNAITNVELLVDPHNKLYSSPCALTIQAATAHWAPRVGIRQKLLQNRFHFVPWGMSRHDWMSYKSFDPLSTTREMVSIGKAGASSCQVKGLIQNGI